MTEIEPEVPPLPSEMATGDADSPEALMEQLRAQRTEIAETKDTKLMVTGYEELGLKGHHRLMDRPEVEKLAKRAMKDAKGQGRGQQQMNILLDQIIQSTMGFFVKDQALVDESGQTITTWDQLASFLGWVPKDASYANARAALYFVFGDNEFAIGGYGILLNRWMGNTNVEVDGEFLGEVG